MKNEPLSIWCVYEKPRDYPNNWIARRWEIYCDGKTLPTNDVIVSLSLEDVRGCLESEQYGLVRMVRHPNDDPKIVETWI